MCVCVCLCVCMPVYVCAAVPNLRMLCVCVSVCVYPSHGVCQTHIHTYIHINIHAEKPLGTVHAWYGSTAPKWPSLYIYIYIHTYIHTLYIYIHTNIYAEKPLGTVHAWCGRTAQKWPSKSRDTNVRHRYVCMYVSIYVCICGGIRHI
jgi:hypothetical protein